MARRLVIPDNVALTGCAIGMLSFAVGWLTLKPNRLAAGTSLRLWDSFGWGPAAAILGCGSFASCSVSSTIGAAM